jgi:hypothetical protein
MRTSRHNAHELKQVMLYYDAFSSRESVPPSFETAIGCRRL